jgi:hypothetical protein
MYDPDVDPAKDDPNDAEPGLFWDLNDDQISVYRTGGTWFQVFFAGI